VIGRRLAVPESGDINDMYETFQPGDYCGPMPVVVAINSDGTKRYESGVYMELPPGPFIHITSPPWDFRECPDGSLEIGGSILTTYYDENAGKKVQWHGFLDEGHHWREV